MEAMVLNQFNQELVLTEVEKPIPGHGQVLIKVHTCGTCGSDLKIASGKINTTPLPHILGHEVSGEIVECGEGVQNRIGERVAVHIYDSCGQCEWCSKGNYNLCTELKGRIGFEQPGGFAEFVLAPSRNAIVLPDNVAFEEASLIPCAMLAIYHAIKKADVKPSDKIAMLGVGGLGIHGLQFAKLLGAQITAIDLNPEKLALAKTLGSDFTLTYDEFIKEQLNYDVIFDNVGIPNITKECLQKLKKQGRYVMVAYIPKMASMFDSEYMHLNETQIIGSRNGSIPEFKQILELLAEKKIKAFIDCELPLSEANTALKLTQSGKAVGRVILKIH